jgi:hypothetical protein
MGEILPRHYILGIFMFLFLLVGGVSMISQFRASDTSFGDGDDFEQFNKTFNVLDTATLKVDTLKNNTADLDSTPGLLGMLNTLYISGWNTLTLLFSSFSFMTVAFNGLGTFFGVPGWASSIIVSVVTIIILFAVLSAIFQREI